MRAIVRAAAFVLTYLPMMALAKDGPSKEETASFIKTKLAQLEQNSRNEEMPDRSISFSELNCQLTLKSPGWVTSPESYAVRGYESDVALADLDPASGSMIRSSDVASLQFDCRDAKRCVAMRFQGENSGERLSSFQMGHWTDAKTVDRLKRALTHLIELCGGKEELF